MVKAESQTLSQFVIKGVFRKTSELPKVKTRTVPGLYPMPHALPPRWYNCK